MNDKKQIKIIRDGCLVDFLNQEMKELQIAEMKKAIRAVLENRNDIMYIPYLAEPIAEKLVKDGYIKPLPNCIMFPREEYEEIKQYQSYIPEIKKAFDKIRKETAREILKEMFDYCKDDVYGQVTVDFNCLETIARKYGIDLGE